MPGGLAAKDSFHSECQQGRNEIGCLTCVSHQISIGQKLSCRFQFRFGDPVCRFGKKIWGGGFGSFGFVHTQNM